MCPGLRQTSALPPMAGPDILCGKAVESASTMASKIESMTPDYPLTWKGY